MKKVIVSLALALGLGGVALVQGAGVDKMFAKEAAHAGLAEVALGQLSQTKAQNPDVKKLGKQIIDDHTKANEELKSFCKRKGIELLHPREDHGQGHAPGGRRALASLRSVHPFSVFGGSPSAGAREARSAGLVAPGLESAARRVMIRRVI